MRAATLSLPSRAALPEKVRETVRMWKELKSGSAVPAAVPKADPDAEKKAAQLHEDFKRHMTEGRRDEAVRSMTDLVMKYGGTDYVLGHQREFQAILKALKK